VIVRVTSPGGFTLRKVFYTVPSRLISHRLRVRLFDDHSTCSSAASISSPCRVGGRIPMASTTIVDYRHVIHSLRRKPMALLNLVYRERLFPREAYRRTFDLLRQRLPDKKACRLMVDLLALAHERGFEAELADELAADLDAGRRPDNNRLRAQFAPACVPHIVVQLAPLAAYECLLGAGQVGDAA
jgi:hypothetical protein